MTDIRVAQISLAQRKQRICSELSAQPCYATHSRFALDAGAFFGVCA